MILDMFPISNEDFCRGQNEAKIANNSRVCFFVITKKTGFFCSLDFSLHDDEWIARWLKRYIQRLIGNDVRDWVILKRLNQILW